MSSLPTALEIYTMLHDWDRSNHILPPLNLTARTDLTSGQRAVLAVEMTRLLLECPKEASLQARAPYQRVREAVTHLAGTSDHKIRQARLLLESKPELRESLLDGSGRLLAPRRDVTGRLLAPRREEPTSHSRKGPSGGILIRQHLAQQSHHANLEHPKKIISARGALDTWRARYEGVLPDVVLYELLGEMRVMMERRMGLPRRGGG